MIGKVFLSLTIFSSILSQGVNTTFSDERETSDIHVRKKRVLNTNSINTIVPIRAAPFVVHIKKNGRNHCAGAILSEYVVITIGHAVLHDDITAYKVYSGHESNIYGDLHNTTSRQIYYGIALLTVRPAIRLNEIARPIQIHEEPLPPGAYGTVYGWGCNMEPPIEFHCNLRAIVVPILKYRECAHRYRGRLHITDEHICTLDRTKIRHCCPGDYGAPLIYMNKLIGIYYWSEDLPHHFNPDVYINVQLPRLSSYIDAYKQRVAAQHR